MNNKPQPRKQGWGEIRLAIAAIALSITLGLWNLFSAGQKQQVVAVSATETEVPPTEELAQMPAPSATSRFLPVKIIFGGVAPQQKVVVQVSASQPQPKRRGGNGGAPQPPVTTGSSKP